MTMFWREDNFKALAEAARIASASPAWVEYGRYCELLEKGLRQEALSRLNSFTDSASRLSLAERKEFVRWLYQFADESQSISVLMPYPLRVNLLEPTLTEWIVREPENAEPHRLIGTLDHLEEAINLNPNDEITCERLINLILSDAGYSIEHLRCCHIRDPKEDFRVLERAETFVERLSNEEKRMKYKNEILELQKIIEAYWRGE